MNTYKNLKDYLQLNYKQTIIHGLNEFISKQHDVRNSEAKDLTIHTLSIDVTFPIENLIMTIGVSVSFSDSIDIKFYNIMLGGDITACFSDLHVMAVEDASKDTLQPETVLSLFGLPNVSIENIESEAEKIHHALSTLIPVNKHHKYWFQVAKIKEKYGLKMWPAELPDNCLGQLHFQPSMATIYDPKNLNKPYHNEPIPANTILLNVKYYKNETETYDDVITAAHELIHWNKHQLYIRIIQLLNNNTEPMSCSYNPLILTDDMTQQEKAYFYAEWQANELGFRLAMPKYLIDQAIVEYNNDESVHNPTDVPFSGHYYQNMIYKLSVDFNVPPEIMKLRLRQLGYDFADGTFLSIDGCIYKPFTFKPGSLNENETFVIGKADYEKLLKENKNFAQLIESRKLIYTGCVVCIYSEKYLMPYNIDEKIYFDLSDYARENVDECCIKFSFNNHVYISTPISVYSFKYLCELEDVTYSIIIGGERSLTEDTINKMNVRLQDTAEEREAAIILGEMKDRNINTFDETVKFHKINKGKKFTYAIFAEKANMNEETLKSYVAPKGTKSYRPISSLEDVMRLCNALNLQYYLSKDLIKKAGYALNTDEGKHAVYDCLLHFTNATLDEWDLMLENKGYEKLKCHTERAVDKRPKIW